MSNNNIFFYDIYTYNIDKLAHASVAPVIYRKVKGLDINEERLVVEAQAAGEILMAICQNKSITFKFNSDHSHGDPRTIQRGTNKRGLIEYNDISQNPEKGATSFAVIKGTQVPIAYDSKYCTYARMLKEAGYYGYVDYKIITGTINNQWTVYLNIHVDHEGKTNIYILLKDINENHPDICLGLFYISLNQQGEIKFFIDELPESYKQFEKTQSDLKKNVEKARKGKLLTEEKKLRESVEMGERLAKEGDYDKAERHAVIAESIAENLKRQKTERKILEGILVNKEINDINKSDTQKELIKVDRERIPNLCILLDTLVKIEGKKLSQQKFMSYIHLLLTGNDTERERETLYLSEKINKGPEIDKEEIKKHARLLLVFDNKLEKIYPHFHEYNTIGALPDGSSGGSIADSEGNPIYLDRNGVTFSRAYLLDRAGKKLSNILQGRISKGRHALQSRLPPPESEDEPEEEPATEPTQPSAAATATEPKAAASTPLQIMWPSKPQNRDIRPQSSDVVPMPPRDEFSEEKTKAFLFIKYILMLEKLSEDNTFVHENKDELTSCMDYARALWSPQPKAG